MHNRDEEAHQSDTTVNGDAPGLCLQVMGVLSENDLVFLDRPIWMLMQHFSFFVVFFTLLDLTGSDFV